MKMFIIKSSLPLFPIRTEDSIGNYVMQVQADSVRQEEDSMKDRMLQFFEYDHLPSNLQEVSHPFSALANLLPQKLPKNAERTVALR